MNFYEITIQRISHLSINFEIITTQQQKKNQMTGMGTTKGIIFENNIIRKKCLWLKFWREQKSFYFNC